MPNSPPRPRRPRRWRWIFLSLLGLVLMVVGSVLPRHAWRCHVTGQELQAAVSELDRADPRWRYEDVEADRQPPPGGLNSADVVLAAHLLLPPEFPSRPWTLPDTVPTTGEFLSLQEKLDGQPSNVRFDPELLRRLCRELMAGEVALPEARRLENLPEGRYAIEDRVDYLNTPLPHMARIQAVVWLLTADATFRAHEGDLKGAWVSTRAAMNGGRSLGDEVDLIAVMVRAAKVVQAVTCAERLVAQGESDPSDLEAFQGLLEREERESVPALLTALRAERALAHRMMEALEAGQFDVDECIEGRKGPEIPAWGPVKRFFLVPWVRHSHAAYLPLASQPVEVARRPLPEWRAAIVAGLARPKDPEVPLAEVVGSSGWKVLEWVQRKQAVLRSGAAALAAERFRLEKGRWPTRLAELTPGYLTTAPVDPYDGTLLRMRRTEDGLVIYSIGQDEVDEGGELDRKKPTRQGADLGFRLWDVDHRGLTP